MTEAKIRIGAVDDTQRVFGQVRAGLQGISSTADVVGSSLAKLGVGLSVAAIVGFTRGVVNSLDALNDLKDATGASIENISALEDVAARTGTSFDTVGASLVKFNAALKEAKPGSDIAAAFDAIGLSIKDLKALDPAEALRQTAVALAGFADDGNKARLTQELFGKSLREVAPFLKDLSEQGKLVATVTAQQAEEAEKFNKQLLALEKNYLNLERVVVGPVISSMNELIEKFKEGSKEGKGFFSILTDRYVSNTKEVYAALGIGKGAAKPPQFTLDYNQSAAETARLARKKSVDFDGAVKGGSKPRGGGKPQAEQITEAQRALAQYVEGLSRTIEKSQELTEVERALNFLRAQGTQGQVPQVRELVLGLAQQIDAERELKDAQEQRIKIGRELATEDGKRVEEENKAYRERIRQLTENTASEVFKRQQSDLEFLKKALDATDISDQQYIESVRELYGLNNENMEKTKSLADELGLSFTSAFEDAIVGGKGLSSVLKGLERDIIGIITRQYVTKPLADGIGKFLGGGDGGSGGGLGGLLVKGFNSIFGGFKATGGPVLAGTPYMVGERGPEMFVPRSAGTIVPNGAAGNVININVNQSFAAGTSRATTLQAAADARRQLELCGRNL